MILNSLVLKNLWQQLKLDFNSPILTLHEQELRQ